MQSGRGQIEPGAVASDSTSAQALPGSTTRKRKGHRGGKKKRRDRRKSFATPLDEMTDDALHNEGLDEVRDNFFSVRQNNFSNTSIDSEGLLDHRYASPLTRTSTVALSLLGGFTNLWRFREQHLSLRPRRPSLLQPSSLQQSQPSPGTSRLRTVYYGGDNTDDEDERGPMDEEAPLLPAPSRQRSDPVLSFGGYGSSGARQNSRSQSRRNSSLTGSQAKLPSLLTPGGTNYNVNYPPSVPGTPRMRPSHGMDMSLGDVMLRDELDLDEHSHDGSLPDANITPAGHDQTFQQPPKLDRRHTIALEAEEDVCFPQEGLSEIADDELHTQDSAEYPMRARRRRGKWPDLSILEEWSKFEQEGRSQERRTKKITEPQLINGRLRPVHKAWSHAEEVSPYRFTYFNEQFQSTIHSQTIAELVQPGASFRELFIPDPPILSDSSDDEDEDDEEDHAATLRQVLTGQNADIPPLAKQRSDSHAESHKYSDSEAVPDSKHTSGEHTPAEPGAPRRPRSPELGAKTKAPRYGERPVWWLDVLCPTEAEMKVLSKAFGIHPLTSEDVMVQEPREKVELFRHYYFVNYRTFEQDRSNPDFLEPVNMYVIVFREGLLSFHFSMTPHPANVRRRVRQLRDYLILSSDWISYAIIDDITDVFVPLIQDIEEAVDSIDDAVLQLPSSDQERKERSKKDPEKVEADAGGDMLRRVGDCRKKVMSLYRLLSNKADVIKGFAKRCNAHVEVAPRSEIGLYLGDIQDHIVTMTGNLSHYEK